MTEAPEGYSCRPESLYRSAETVSPRKYTEPNQPGKTSNCELADDPCVLPCAADEELLSTYPQRRVRV